MNNNQLQELQNTISQIYLKNINFLKRDYNNIYKKIEILEKQNRENCSLEFINNHFELLINNTPYYNKDPFIDANNRVVNYDSEYNLTLIRQNQLLSYPKYDNGLDGYELENILSRNINFIEKETKKFIFFGIGLGVHLNDFHNHLKLKNYLIIEKNIEIFRLSLFLTDYEIIAQDAKLFFCIDENEITKEKIINYFFNYEFCNNIKIGFEILDVSYISDFDIVLKIVEDLKEGNYPYSEYITTLERTKKYFDEGRDFFNFKNNKEFFKNKPTLFLSAGPSLAKNLENIYLYQDYFIIVTASAALKRLELLDIKPDIIIIADAQKDVIMAQLEVNKELYKDSTFIVCSSLDEDVYEKIKDCKVYFFQTSIEYFDEKLISGSTVGDIGIKLLLEMGTEELYLLGIDAALNSKTGKSHDGLHQSSKNINIDDNSVFFVNGNFEDKVPTTKLYNTMINDISNTVACHNAKVYNLSNGAYFNGTMATTFSQISLNSIFKKNKLVLNIVNNNEIKIKVDKDNKKELKVLKSFNNVTYIKLLDVINNISRKFDNSVIVQIYIKFYNLVAIYCDNEINIEIINQELKKIYEKLCIIYK